MVCSGGNVDGQTLGVDLENVLGFAKIAQPVLAEVSQLHAVRQRVANQVAGGLGHDHLPASGRGQQPGQPVEGRSQVVALVRFRGAGVERHPHGERPELAPILGHERPLRGDGGSQGVGSGGEGRLDGVADRLEPDAVVGGDGLVEQGEVALHRAEHGRCVLLPTPGAPLDVGEQEGDGAAGKLGHGIRSATVGTGPLRAAGNAAGDASTAATSGRTRLVQPQDADLSLAYDRVRDGANASGPIAALEVSKMSQQSVAVVDRRLAVGGGLAAAASLALPRLQARGRVITQRGVAGGGLARFAEGEAEFSLSASSLITTENGVEGAPLFLGSVLWVDGSVGLTLESALITNYENLGLAEGEGRLIQGEFATPDSGNQRVRDGGSAFRAPRNWYGSGHAPGGRGDLG